VPADDGVGLHDHEVVLPVLEEATNQHPEGAVAVVEPDTLGAALQDVDLLTQDEVLDGRAVPVGCEGSNHGQQLKDESHSAGSRGDPIDARPHEAVESKKRATKRVSAAVFGFREGQVPGLGRGQSRPLNDPSS